MSVINEVSRESYRDGIIEALISMRDMFGADVEESDLWQENCIFCCGACGENYSVMQSEGVSYYHHHQLCEVALDEALNA